MARLTDRIVKSINAASFTDGDLVKLPSNEIARYSAECPPIGARGWHLHPQTKDGQGSKREGTERADGGKAFLWKNADRSIGSTGAMFSVASGHQPIWMGGLTVPAHRQTIPCLLDIDYNDGDHTYLCSDCYLTGPEGDGSDEYRGDHDGHVTITASDRGYCEVCGCEYVVECDRLNELPDGTLERDALSVKDKIDRLAQTFRSKIRSMFSANTLANIDIANAALAKQGSHACSTQDLCDANMVMHAAFEVVMGRPPNTSEDDEDNYLWNSAWDRAKSKGFSIEPIELAKSEAEQIAAWLDTLEIDSLEDIANMIRRGDWKTPPKAAPVDATPVDATLRCPHCGCTDLEQFMIRETYRAYHPIEAFDVKHGKAWIQIASALATICPSEHFDDGEADYQFLCNACGHGETPEAFGLDADTEWEWV